MDIKGIKLASYVDEASDDPELGCKLIFDCNILYAGLRHIWSDNICNLSSIGHKKLKKILSDANISVIMIASEIGKNNKLQSVQMSEVDNAINICKYYNAPYLRIFLNYQENPTQWLTELSIRCVNSGVVPLLELLESQTYKPVDLAELFSKNKHCKLHYDPVSLIMRRNIDPFTRYWVLLKSYVSMIDIRDMKIGRGYKPAGFGDSKINMTIVDAISSNYDGWFIMEPSLGRKHGTTITKADTFKYALDGLKHILANLESNNG